MGNAVPGLVLGILIGKRRRRAAGTMSQSDDGRHRFALFVLSGFFRGAGMKMIESFQHDGTRQPRTDPTTRSAANNGGHNGRE